MKRRLFSIPSLLAAGLLPLKAKAAPIGDAVSDAVKSGPDKSLFDIFRLPHKYILAGHRSHRSHRSHSSHRSSSGGSYYYRSPTYSSPSPSYSAPLYSAPSSPAPVPSVRSPGSGPTQSSGDSASRPGFGSPSPASPAVLPGNSNRFAEIVKQVQLGMLAFGYYNGPINGIVSPDTRDALTRLQTDYGLKATGTITPQTLDALRIKAD